ncbi:MAG: Fic family protein [Spirochaetales bacterium]|nr:Fic family protein [Spirochaetales bacterium]
MISYKGLESALKEKGIGKTDLSKNLGISTRTIAKITKGQKLSKKSIQKIADFLGRSPDSIMEEISDNKILQTLREEKAVNLSGGLYHTLQVRMAYNSNHIEGSRLSEDQTRFIFETNTINAGDTIQVDDILETIHHFRAVDYVIDTAEDVLTEDSIKKLHYILKHDTKDSSLTWFAVGDYKQRANVVGGKETAKPSEVHSRIKELLDEYNAKKTVAIQDIIAFHAEFELIHPFQDGNGRVGRLLALKECLRHNIVPFIIEDTKKNFYYRGLNEWHHEQNWLIDTCLDGQDTFKKMLNMLDVEY